LRVIAVLFVVAAGLARRSGFRLNHTPSVPVGLWRIQPHDGPIERGQIISFCSPDTPLFREALAGGWIGHGRCAGGWEPFLKPVITTAGDHIEPGEKHTSITGRIVHGRRQLERGCCTRVMPEMAGFGSRVT
jgi:conjugative transfer signal peptidase TraF